MYDITEGLSREEGLLYASSDDTQDSNVTWDYVVAYVQGGRNYEIT